MKLYNESKGKKLENLLKKCEIRTDITSGIRMLKEASGCLKDVSGCYKKASGCYKKASGCVHLPDPKTTNRDTVERK